MNRLISRRAIVLGSLSSALAHSVAASTPKPVAGAIRWDAWYARKDASVYAQRNLSGAEFRGRAPAHCIVDASKELDCEGNQKIIDAEITAASRAGLSYWAFDWFQET